MKDAKFWYWINERQRIFLRKEAGEDPPWTTDEILRRYKFTNVFREQDRVTRELRKRVTGEEGPAVLLWRICLFRMFNWPPTYDEFLRHGLVRSWRFSDAKQTLRRLHLSGEKIFTGAYIITNAGRPEPKYEVVAEALTEIWEYNRAGLAKRIAREQSIEYATRKMMQFPLIGKFVAYEIATDLRHTPLLSGAKDKMTWANAGPGARRGLNRIFRGQPKEHVSAEQHLGEMCKLLSIAPKNLDSEIFTLKQIGTFELRDIEHSLCEFDKYMRVKNGEGEPRALYRGG